MKKHIIVVLTNRTVKIRLFLLGALFLLLACSGQKKTTNSTLDSSGAMELLVQDEYNGNDIQESLVIKNEKHLRAFYSKINRARKPGLPLPDIDFTKEIVVVYCSGQRNDGTMPFLTKVDETEKEIVIQAEHKRGTQKTSAITSPFSLYKVPFTEKSILFKTNKK